jgi:hypothetical protein
LCGYELGIGFGFRSGKEGTPGGLSWAAREAGPAASANGWRAGWAAQPELGQAGRMGRAGVGKGSGCRAGLGFQPGFGPVPDRN